MKPSPVCISLIEGFETCAKAIGGGEFAAYMPTPNDRPTIGWGSTGPDIVMGLTWTRAQCDARFAADLAKFAARVAASVTGETGQNQFDAMVSLAYNIGASAFKGSTLLRLHNAGDFAGADVQFAVWNKQAGRVLPGLVRRRAAEAAMYRGGGDAALIGLPLLQIETSAHAPTVRSRRFAPRSAISPCLRFGRGGGGLSLLLTPERGDREAGRWRPAPAE